MGIYAQQSPQQITINLSNNIGSIFNGVQGNFNIILDVSFINSLVNIHFPSFLHMTSSLPGVKPIIFQFPGIIQPKNLESFDIAVIANNNTQQGRLLIDTSGFCTLNRFPNVGFTPSSQSGFQYFSISYITKEIPT